MAFARVSGGAIQSGRMPRVCMCCGQRAEQMVEHRFYFDPAFLMVISLVLPRLSRLISGDNAVDMMAPLCNAHKGRFQLMTYLGFAIAGVALLFVPLMIYFTYTKQTSAQGWSAVVLIVMIVAMLGGMLALRLMSPRLVEVRGGDYGFTGVAPEFANQFGGGATGGGSSMSGKQMVLALVIGGGALALLIVGVVVVGFGMRMYNQRQTDAFFARSHAEGEAKRKEFIAENRMMAEMTPEQRMEHLRKKHQMPGSTIPPPPMHGGPGPGAGRQPTPRVIPPPVVTPPPTSSTTAPMQDPTKTVTELPTTTKPAPRATRGKKRSPVHTTSFDSPGERAWPPQSVALPPNTPLPRGEEVWAVWGGFWYPATVVEVTAQGVKVHYPGFGDSSDEVKVLSDVAIDEAILAEHLPTAAPEVTAANDPPPPVTEPLPTTPAAPKELPLRHWSDATGQFKIEGRLVKVEQGKATLLKSDGKEIVVPIERLSAADQAYLKALPSPP